MLKIISHLLVLSCILLAACSAIAPQPTATPIPTATPLPTDTPVPTETPLPTPTVTTPPSTATSTPDSIANLVPVGTPDKKWNDIPIMPGALAGQGDATAYRFTIKATTDEIQSYYEKQLTAAGWTSLAGGTGESGTTLIIFMKDLKTLSVSIIPFDDLFIVMIVK